jgi:hypothetical protein
MKRAMLTVLCAAFLAAALSRAAFAQSPAGPKFLTFAFTTDSHGWAGGAAGIAVTDDGGHSWTPQFRGRRIDQLVIVRRRSVYALASGAVLHTADGAHWDLISIPRPALKRIAFSSDRDGLGIALRGRLFATSDGGRSWHHATFDKPVTSVCFSDRRTGYVGGAVAAPALGAFDGIAKTVDGANSWSVATRPPSAGLVGIAGHSLHCTGDSVFDLVDLGAHAGGGAYLLARSIDGAKTWSPIVVGGQAPRLRGIPVGPGTEATSMSAYNASSAYVAGFCGACGPTGLSSFGATTNAGSTWHNTQLGAIGFTSAPVFTSPIHGFIGARVVRPGSPPQDEVLATNDAGLSWANIYTAK